MRLVLPHVLTRQGLEGGCYCLKSYESGGFFDTRTNMSLIPTNVGWLAGLASYNHFLQLVKTELEFDLDFGMEN